MSSLSEIEGWRTLSLDDLAAKLATLSEADRNAIVAAAGAATANTKFIPNVGPQMAAFFSPADICFYGGAAGGGKALALDTPLATPVGWTTMGDVQTGDTLFSEDGSRCRVVARTEVMVGRPCYRVAFSDGASIVADASHQWLTMTAVERDATIRRSDEWRARRRANRPSRAKAISQKPWVSEFITANNRERQHTYLVPPTGTVRTTAEIAATLRSKGGDGFNHSLPVAKAIACSSRSLIVDPYVLGAWLGDGNTASATFTTADEEMVEGMTACGYRVSKRSAKYQYGILGGLQVALREIGVLGNKHIPDDYLRSSSEQRLSLLQGLMDTDGYCEKRGQCDFSTTLEILARGVLELLASLGIKASVREGIAKLDGRAIGPKYSIKFLTELPAFRLKRKLIRQKRGGFRGTHERRYIVAVDPVPSVLVRCIQVDSPSSLFLAGREMIPTHNSSLICGLALTEHERTLIMRQQYNDLDALTEELIRLNGSRKGFNGSNPPSMRTEDGRFIQFSGAVTDQWQGHAFDLKCADEATQIDEAVIRYHIGWLRSVKENQRKRAMLCSNPPIDERGQYLLGLFRPWLDTTHPNPAKDGELRWYVRTPDDEDLEVDGPEPIQFPGEENPTIPMSRTFIRARLRDNPYLANSGYQKSLDQMQEPYRSAMRDGNFFAVRRDKPDQVIPMEWISAAQARWTPRPPAGFRMTAVGFDVGQGGIDRVVAAPRYGFWYDTLKVAKGKDAPDGPSQAAFVERNRRDGAPIVVDVGGGFGGDVCSVFKSNSTPYLRFNGVEEGLGKTNDGSGRGFVNRRAQAWWRFREALNPDQPGGSEVCLPPDQELASELSSPTLIPDKRDIQIESKKDIRKRLGKSPDKADAVVMAWEPGERAQKRKRMMNQGNSQPARANIGYGNIKNVGSPR